jgi:multidrug efflux pump subunit AcrA (membrane-fusion protein)
MRDKIDGEVYQKVLVDYDARYADLERSASSLIARAKAEYQQLSNEWAQLTRMSEQAKTSVAESMFRHAVGEIDNADLAERVREPEQVQATCADKLAVLDAQRARYAEALPGLDLQQPSALSAAATDTTAVQIALPEANDTVLVPGHLGSDDMTVILPDAILVPTHAPAERFRLGVVSYLGRDEDNHVQLASEHVSHRHAVITATRRGFVLTDLQSRNGTFVNGERVQEHTLVDGDRIELGSLELTFRMPGLGVGRRSSKAAPP